MNARELIKATRNNKGKKKTPPCAFDLSPPFLCTPEPHNTGSLPCRQSRQPEVLEAAYESNFHGISILKALPFWKFTRFLSS